MIGFWGEKGGDLKRRLVEEDEDDNGNKMNQ